MRGVVAAVAALWLFASLFPVTVAAISQPPTVTPTVTTDVQGPCVVSDPSEWTWTQNSTSKQSQSRSGTLATINLSNAGFHMCTNGVVIKAGPAAWVSIEPCPSCPQSGTMIIQVGVIECVSFPYPGLACFGANQPHFFWAWGGCNGALPFPLDMGPANYGSHAYALYLDVNMTWHLQIDGAAQGTSKHKVLPNTYVSCWSNSNQTRQSKWSTERWNLGDSEGNTNDETIFSGARYGVFNQGWFNPLFTDCFWSAPDSVCTVLGSDSLSVRTTS
jgi:hypothetical protein